MAIPTNPVSIGDTTKKSNYDTLYNNAILCDTGGVAGGAQTIPGKKDFSDGIGVDYLTGLSAGGAIGISTTDLEAWGGGVQAVEFPLGAIAYNSGSPYMRLVNNVYYDGSWKYKSTDQAAGIFLNETGIILFGTAVSGTVDTALTWVYKLKIDNATDSIGIGGYGGGSNRDSYFYFATDTWFAWDESTDSLNLYGPTNFYIQGDILPTNTESYIIGNATYYFIEVSAKSFVDRSAIWIENPDSAYDILKNAQNEETTGFCARAELRGQNRLKYSDFPDYCWDRAEEVIEEDIFFDDKDVIIGEAFISQNRAVPSYRKGDKIISKGAKTRYRVNKKKRKNEQNGEEEEYKEILIAAEGFDLSAGISVLMGAVQKLIQRVEAQQIEIDELKGVRK